VPSKSGKQHRLMALVANDPKAAKRLGIPQKVGKEFMKKDKGKKFSGGGASKSDDSDKEIENLGRRYTGTYGETREALSSLSPSQKRKALAAGVTTASALSPARAGAKFLSKMSDLEKAVLAGAVGKGAAVTAFDKEQRRKKETEEKNQPSYRKGGSVKSSASRRADGIAQRGKTRGKFI
jgi:hypothetical protein